MANTFMAGLARGRGWTQGAGGVVDPAGQIAPLSANLQQLLSSPALGRELARAGKSLLLSNLTRDWPDEFERIIVRAAAGAELRKLGY